MKEWNESYSVISQVKRSFKHGDAALNASKTSEYLPMDDISFFLTITIIQKLAAVDFTLAFVHTFINYG